LQSRRNYLPGLDLILKIRGKYSLEFVFF